MKPVLQGRDPAILAQIVQCERSARHRFVTNYVRTEIHAHLVPSPDFDHLSRYGHFVLQSVCWWLVDVSLHRCTTQCKDCTVIRQKVLRFYYHRISDIIRRGRPDVVEKYFGVPQLSLWATDYDLPLERAFRRPARRARHVSCPHFMHRAIGAGRIELRRPPTMDPVIFEQVYQDFQDAALTDLTMATRALVMYIVVIYAIKRDYARILVYLAQLGAVGPSVYKDLNALAWLTLEEDGRERYISRPKVSKYLVRFMLLDQSQMRVKHPAPLSLLSSLWECVV